jgi:hypothetical protein
VTARRVTALDVPCPACGATEGQVCQRLDGGGRCTTHSTRVRRAKSIDVQLHPEHVAGQLPLWGKK